MKTYFFILLTTTLFSTQLLAARYCTHGNSGMSELQNSAVLKTQNMGWGTEINLNGYNRTNWIHFNIPQKFDDNTIDRIDISYKRQNRLIHISAVHGWSSYNKFLNRSLDNQPMNPNDKGYETLKLGPDMPYIPSSAGISIQVKNSNNTTGWFKLVISQICVVYN